MQQPKLPLPNPEDWVSIRGAAAICRTSRRTIERRLKSGDLTGYLPYGANDMPSNYILWKNDVLLLGDALARVRGGQ